MTQPIVVAIVTSNARALQPLPRQGIKVSSSERLPSPLMIRDSRKSRKHGKHGSRVFVQMPCFWPNAVLLTKCRVFDQICRVFAAKSCFD